VGQSRISCRDQKEGQYGQTAGDDQPASEELPPNAASPTGDESQGNEARGESAPAEPDLEVAEVPGHYVEGEGAKVPRKRARQDWPTQPLVPAVWTLLKQLDQQTGDEEG